MTETTSIPVSRRTLKRKAEAPNATTPPAPAARIRAKHAIVRTIPRGSRIDPDAMITMRVENPCTGIKNHARWSAGFPEKGQSARVKDILAVPGGPTIGDMRYSWERAWIDIAPPPAPIKK